MRIQNDCSGEADSTRKLKIIKHKNSIYFYDELIDVK